MTARDEYRAEAAHCAPEVMKNQSVTMLSYRYEAAMTEIDRLRAVVAEPTDHGRSPE